MNESESETKSSPATTTSATSFSDEPADLKQEVAALQRQVTTLLLAMVVLSGIFATYMYVLARQARRDLQGLKQPASQLIQAFNQEKSAMDNLVARLSDYGRTHADFVPILNKYRIPVATSAPPVLPKVAPAAPPAPVAAPAAAPKK